MHLNPTTANIVKKPEKWLMSSYCEYISKIDGNNRICKFDDILDATIYLKRQEDICHYQKITNKYGLDELPTICVLADVCRDELLFELDAIVVQNNQIHINNI